MSTFIGLILCIAIAQKGSDGRKSDICWLTPAGVAALKTV